ncbi:hypothetical protein ZWY2020_008477 [Hordeum vulgare]|nr:hypothetical protein ZWY2020_008477 [Hordeum vulgare]
MSSPEMVDGTWEWDGLMSPTGLQLAKLLKGLNGGENPVPAFVHQANAYCCAPEHLIRGRRHAPGMGHGMQGSFYFHSDPAPVKKGRRIRKVPGGSWHSEKTESWDFVEREMHLSCVAYKRTFSYIVKSLPGMKRHRGRQRTGWIMAEISLDEHGHGNGADNKVLCVVHKSTHNYAGSSMHMAATSSLVKGCTRKR